MGKIYISMLSFKLFKFSGIVFKSSRYFVWVQVTFKVTADINDELFSLYLYIAHAIVIEYCWNNFCNNVSRQFLLIYLFWTWIIFLYYFWSLPVELLELGFEFQNIRPSRCALLQFNFINMTAKNSQILLPSFGKYTKLKCIIMHLKWCKYHLNIWGNCLLYFRVELVKCLCISQKTIREMLVYKALRLQI